MDHFLRLLDERIERAILLLLLQCFFVRVILELVNQFLDRLFADVIVFLDNGMGQSMDSEVYFTRTGFLYVPPCLSK